MLTPENFYIRSGPENSDSPTEGAFENGKKESVVGRKLVPGDILPDFWMAHSSNRLGALDLYDQINFDDVVQIVGINELFSEVCKPQVKDCLVIRKFSQTGIRKFIITNESVDTIVKFESEELDYRSAPIYSVEHSNAAIKLGNQMLRGDIQRSLIAAIKQPDGSWKVVDAQYIYDQGGPLPDYNRSDNAIAEARPDIFT